MDLTCPQYLLVIIGNICQFVPTASWVVKVSSIAKVHMSPGMWHFAVLVAGVSLVSILQASDWARDSTSSRHYFSKHITTIDWHHDSV